MRSIASDGRHIRSVGSNHAGHAGRLRGLRLAMVVAALAVLGGSSRVQAAECQFETKASNNLSFDVWVDLYDSMVTKPGIGVFGGMTQMKIQNHRIRTGQKMDRRYTAPGRCAMDRTWWIKFRRGSAQKTLEIKTGGTSSTSRTVDLGASSKWKPID